VVGSLHDRELATHRRLLEIACDESGYEGEKLVGGTTDVFAHASVRIDTESAAECMRELRDRIRSPATEYKANHLLRQKHRSVLIWLLGPSGPLHGNAHVYLVDKAFFALGKVMDLLVEEATAPAVALTLYGEGRRTFDHEQWQAFLVSSNNLMRTKGRLDFSTSVDSFFRMVDVLRLAGTPGRVEEILGLLWRARPHADAFRAGLLHNPATIPALDPLIPAIVRAVAYWGSGRDSVAIVHDRQNALSEERVAQLMAIFRGTLMSDSSTGRLASLNLVASHSDPRIQMADILAGTARKIAEEELNGRGDAQLTALLPPYVDSGSIWGDDRSWSLLKPMSSPGAGT
jgi:hypothetical protein